MSELLLIEDDVSFRAALTTALSRFGYQIRTAGDGASALELISKHHFSLLLVDFSLPGINGAELIRLCRENHDIRDIPIIAISALSHGESILRFNEVGVNCILTKSSFSISELKDTISTLLAEPKCKIP